MVGVMDYNYEELLGRAWGNLPEKLKTSSRFVMPEVNTFIEGNQTIIKNFNEIADKLQRKPQHMLQYLLRDLAAPAAYDGNRVVIQRVLKRSLIQQRIDSYVEEYVLCHECRKPDTVITELAGEKIIRCEACGGWRPFRRIK